MTGPTASGKSGLAYRLAKELQLAILSADSIQVYRGMDIGTAKASRSEMNAVQHEMVDIRDPSESFSVQEYVQKADEVCRKRQGRVLVCGGTPFYLDALCHGVSGAPVNDEIEMALSVLSTEEARRWLEKLDPPRAEKLHPNDRYRTIRALCIILTTGKRASDYSRERAPRPGVKCRWVFLTAPRKLMHERIEDRVQQMMEQGLLKEAKQLYENGRLSRTAAAAVGYKELFAHFRGECSLEQAVEKIIVHTRRLCRHQEIWFRRFEGRRIPIDPPGYENAYRELKNEAERFFSAKMKDE